MDVNLARRRSETFTLEKLAKFYIAAAKSGGMQYFGYARFDGDDGVEEDGWDEVFNGPNLGSIAVDWRPKPAQPIVRYAIKNTNTVTTVRSPESYDDSVMERSWVSYGDAKSWLMEHPSYAGSIIKLVEEQT